MICLFLKISEELVLLIFQDRFWRICSYGQIQILTIVGYLMPNPLYTYISNIYDLVWLGFMAYRPL